MTYAYTNNNCLLCASNIIVSVAIPTRIVSKISKFADDTKLCARVNNEEDAKALKGDLDKLHK